MSREEPFFRKCCYCIPLKSCLQTWACVKSIADISISVFFVLIIIILSNGYYDALTLDRFTASHFLLILIVVMVIDSVFMVVLSIGLWTKSLKNLRLFYYYSIYMVITDAVFVIGITIYALICLRMDIYSVTLAVFVLCGFINFGLDVCIIVTLKSEIIKLRNKQQYEFVKMPTLYTEDGERARSTEPFHMDEENLNA